MDSKLEGASEIKSSNTVIELKTNLHSSEGCSADSYLDMEKPKPPTPPLDVSTAPEYVAGPKTPVFGQIRDRRKLKEKIGHRRVDEEGQITFKKIETSQLMASIQLGISHSVGRLASKPERDLLMHDFTIVESTFFPREGSNTTPAHHYCDFRFKAYAPIAFRYFRDLFGIQPDDYLLSLCNSPLQELSNPGASGSIFYLSADDEFIIKTVDHREAEFLQKLLPGYYMNLNQNPRTLLPKFFGLYCFQTARSKKNIRLVVMNNLLPSVITMHFRYDLKGSTYKRKASKAELKKSSPTYKDLDFLSQHPDGILLESETYNALTKTIQRDCRVLESFQIMDYSLLVGIHNVSLAKREKQNEIREMCITDSRKGYMTDEKDDGKKSPTHVGSPAQFSCEKNDSVGLARSKSINRQRLFAFSTAMESINSQAATETLYESDGEDVPPGGIPAKSAKGDSLLLYLGIIDILQSFRLRKRLEHTLKSMVHDGETISVHRPSFYAVRFFEFMSKTVFRKNSAALKQSPSKRKDKGVGVPSRLMKSECAQEESPLLCTTQNPPSVSFYSTEKGGSGSAKGGEEKKQMDGTERDDKCSEASQPRKKGRQQKSSSNIDQSKETERIISLRSSKGLVTGKTSSVSWDKTEVVSLSQVTLQTESAVDCVSETSSSSTSGLGSTLHTVTWTPPHSVEGSTPTHTEGTPSFTESSSSGDAACPTTPVKSINKSLDSLPPLGETQILQGSEMTRL